MADRQFYRGGNRTAVRRANGTSLIETMVSLVLLGAVLVATAQLLQTSAAQYRAVEKKRCALELATTVLDRVTTRDWEALTQRNVGSEKLPERSTEFLGEARLAITVTPEPANGKTQQLPAKKVSVDISWTNSPSKRQDHVRLTSWVFPQGVVQ